MKKQMVIMGALYSLHKTGCTIHEACNKITKLKEEGLDAAVVRDAEAFGYAVYKRRKV